MTLKTKKEEFLSNTLNKQRLTNMLGNQLEAAGCDVHYAKGDADVMVVEGALASSERKNTVVIADDTDILTLLVYHSGHIRNYIWFQPSLIRGRNKG